MTKTKTQVSILLWSEDGQIGCPIKTHAPFPGTDTWCSGRWRQMTTAERTQFEAETGHPARCESCEAEAEMEIKEPTLSEESERRAKAWGSRKLEPLGYLVHWALRGISECSVSIERDHALVLDAADQVVAAQALLNKRMAELQDVALAVRS